MTWPRLLAAIACIVIFGWSGLHWVRDRSERFLALFWMGIAVTLGVMAVHPEVIESMGPDGDLLRLRIIIGLLSFLVLTITLEAVRRTHMQERYALLWVATGLILLLMAFFPRLIAWLESLTGMHYGAVMAVVVFIFLLLVVFHFSVAMSRFQNEQTKLAQKIALLEARLEDAEAEKEQGRP